MVPGGAASQRDRGLFVAGRRARRGHAPGTYFSACLCFS